MPHVAEKTTPNVETIHRVPHTSKIIADVIDDGIEMAKRVGKHSSDAAEELMDDTVNRVKRHPVESMVMIFALGFIVGGLVDWLTRRNA